MSVPSCSTPAVMSAGCSTHSMCSPGKAGATSTPERPAAARIAESTCRSRSWRSLASIWALATCWASSPQKAAISSFFPLRHSAAARVSQASSSRSLRRLSGLELGV